MRKFAIVDLSNLFFTVRHSIQGDASDKAGMAFHIMFRSLRKIYRELGADHIVFALDSSSWRYDVYPFYKGKRKADRLNRTEKEKDEDEVYFSAFYSLIDFLKLETNCTVLQKEKIEADDFVAGWVQAHPDDQHIIVSADSDFVQLLDKNVKIYDGIKDLLISTTEIINKENKKVDFIVNPKNGKIKVGQPNKDFVPEDGWWKYALFVKLIRGDSGDGIFPAYPRVMAKSTKNSIGFREAWEDRSTKGYIWNNFMLTEWDKANVLKEGVERVTVKDEFKINEMLIDLTKQPDDVRTRIFEAIEDEINLNKDVGQVGFRFLKFCKQHDLPALSDETKTHTSYLGAKYNG